jgi:hypothetical protein
MADRAILDHAAPNHSLLVQQDFCPNLHYLIFAFEASRAQLFRNATGWGSDFASLGKTEFLACIFP